KNITPNNLNPATLSGNPAKMHSNQNKTTATTAQSSTSAHIDNTRINRLFTRMNAIYGHIWQSQFKPAEFLTVAKQEWEETLREFQDDTINQAVNTCKKRHEMPPTLPMLYQLCRSIQPPKRLSTMIPSTTYKPINPEMAKIYTQKIKEMLSRVRNN
ncbi:MAG: hypothetical protein NTU49_06835, partial [Gammaproteobacteria bacterium]|nr:hypothetical protein [Gammaproteobacteria bacterium]